MIEKYFPPQPANTPQRKVRGKRRYFRNVQKEASNFIPSLTDDDWYDSWHYHADWPGAGNFGWKYRKQHILALCQVFRKFAENVKSYNKQHQLWICLNQKDAGQDAVFFHTPNPNNDNFPITFDDIVWGETIIENFFSESLPDYSFRCGKSIWMGSIIFFIYSPDIGVSIGK